MDRTYWLIQKGEEVMFLCETAESAYKTYYHYTDYLLREAADTLRGSEMLEELKRIIASKEYFSLEKISALKNGEMLFGYGIKIYPKSVWRDSIGFPTSEGRFPHSNGFSDFEKEIINGKESN